MKQDPSEVQLLRARVSVLVAVLAEARDVLELCDPAGDRLVINAPEDAAVLALCKRHGFGAVIDSAARQWRWRDPVGAFTSGPCVGTLKSTVQEIRAVLTSAVRKVPHDAAPATEEATGV